MTAENYAEAPAAPSAETTRMKKWASICTREKNRYMTRMTHGCAGQVEQAEDYEFPDSWEGDIYFVRCTDPPHCPRSKRPLQCRTYPLAPRLTDEGVLILIKNDENLPYTCPLIVNDMELSDDFIRATYTVWFHLIRDPLIYDLVAMDSEARNQDEED